MAQAKSAPGKREMGRGRSPEPLDFFIWTVEDVGLWLEEINLGGYRQVFEENGVNGEYLESLSMFTTEQILRFIRRCHMKWGDFITLCKELRRIKVTVLHLYTFALSVPLDFITMCKAAIGMNFWFTLTDSILLGFT
ncbi:hypothetical protein BAE44_0005404 [Dichanthelium oligosanthes]|uniref:SAM domain-containing protein n=1 Tax=Dichanthelium oligosanthes TaxID=888268 RepID=A0A1E5W8K6_9POAL|nr:hypothetical protein BAE44_0005404 [Dichanthelium oligosanthes]